MLTEQNGMTILNKIINHLHAKGYNEYTPGLIEEIEKNNAINSYSQTLRITSRYLRELHKKESLKIK